MLSNRKNSGVPSSSGGGDNYSDNDFESLSVSQSNKFIPNAMKKANESTRVSGSNLNVPAGDRSKGKGKYNNYYSPIKEDDEDK